MSSSSSSSTSSSSSSLNNNVDLMNSNLSVSKYIDQAIALQTIKLVEHVFQQRQWGLAMLGTFLFVASIDGAKKVANKLVDKSVDRICNMTSDDVSNVYQMMWYPALQVYSNVSSYTSVVQQKVSSALSALVSGAKSLQSQPESQTQSSRKYAATLGENLWIKIAQHPCFFHSTQVLNITHQQDGKLVQNERWTNNRLVTPEFVVMFNDELQVSFHVTTTFKRIMKGC